MTAILLLLAHSMDGVLRGPGRSRTPLSATVRIQLIPGCYRALLSQYCSHSACTKLLTERNTYWSLYLCAAEPFTYRTKTQVQHLSHPWIPCSPPYLLDRSMATSHLPFHGDSWIPVTHQAVILDTVVLVTEKPVGFHFPFALGQE